MSRSYKKHPYYRIGDSEFKKIYNRKLRRTKPDIPNGNSYKKLNDSYDIVDYNCDCSWEKFKTWKWQWKYYGFKSEDEAYAYWKRKYGSK